MFFKNIYLLYKKIKSLHCRPQTPVCTKFTEKNHIANIYPDTYPHLCHEHIVYIKHFAIQARSKLGEILLSHEVFEADGLRCLASNGLCNKRCHVL